MRLSLELTISLWFQFSPLSSRGGKIPGYQGVKYQWQYETCFVVTLVRSFSLIHNAKSFRVPTFYLCRFAHRSFVVTPLPKDWTNCEQNKCLYTFIKGLSAVRFTNCESMFRSREDCCPAKLANLIPVPNCHCPVALDSFMEIPFANLTHTLHMEIVNLERCGWDLM